MNDNPYREIAVMLQDQMAQQVSVGVQGIPAELGRYLGENALKLDNFKPVINDFLVAEWAFEMHFSAEVVKHVKCKFKPELMPGDRVLCILLNSGQDVIIVSKVVP